MHPIDAIALAYIVAIVAIIIIGTWVSSKLED